MNSYFYYIACWYDNILQMLLTFLYSMTMTLKLSKGVAKKVQLYGHFRVNRQQLLFSIPFLANIAPFSILKLPVIIV